MWAVQWGEWSSCVLGCVWLPVAVARGLRPSHQYLGQRLLGGRAVKLFSLETLAPFRQVKQLLGGHLWTLAARLVHREGAEGLVSAKMHTALNNRAHAAWGVARSHTRHGWATPNLPSEFAHGGDGSFPRCPERAHASKRQRGGGGGSDSKKCAMQGAPPCWRTVPLLPTNPEVYRLIAVRAVGAAVRQPPGCRPRPPAGCSSLPAPGWLHRPAR